ncbi:hypothetical protein E2320_008612 [Naja naja]|nr:hypothetical protein E2320_008612 [Naja naja]
MYGTRCNGCGDFVEGEVVTALGKTYHPNCFACTMCKRPFPPGDRVTFNGRDCLCQTCAQPMASSSKELTTSSSKYCIFSKYSIVWMAIFLFSAAALF